MIHDECSLNNLQKIIRPGNNYKIAPAKLENMMAQFFYFEYFKHIFFTRIERTES